MSIKPLIQWLSFTLIIFIFFYLNLTLHAKAKDFGDEDFSGGFAPLVKKEQRKHLVYNEYGQISAVDITDGIRAPYHIQFFTLEPNSLFLPVLLHEEMVFYVHTGSGRLNWADEEETRRLNLRRGDIFRLRPGSIFYLQSDLEPQRESLRIYAIFPNIDDVDETSKPEFGAYSSIGNLVRGFDKITLKRAFKASDEVIESITSATETEAIVHAISTKKETKKKSLWEMETRILKGFLGDKEGKGYNKKKQTRAFNMHDADPDFENCNGRSITLTRKKAAHLLKGTNIGLFMVNLTKGSMMGPHWNPKATEIAIVLQGQGMVRVVCSSSESIWKSECKNMRFRVKEGDVFAVPRFHPMAQMSFNNDSFVFMGFSTSRKNNHPQFLAGKQSVLQTLDRDVLAVSFNVSNSTIDQLLAPQADSIILDCTSCAEEEERMMEEEIEKEREEEEARKREEEEVKRREEEERRRRREEEEARKREEEEEKRREEEEAKKREEEEERKREEEEAKKREEEERKREEEEARRQEEERQREQEEARRQEEERKRKREEEEERRQEEEREREEEEEERERQQEEQERQREQEERERKREEEERRQEEERQRQEEDERERQQEEQQRQREQEEARRREEERRREQERKRQEEEERQWEQEEARRREEDREKERQQDKETRKQEPKSEQEAAERQADEREQREKQQEEKRRERERQEAEKSQSAKEAAREAEDGDAQIRTETKEKQGGGGDSGRAYLKMWTI